MMEINEETSRVCRVAAAKLRSVCRETREDYEDVLQDAYLVASRLFEKWEAEQKNIAFRFFEVYRDLIDARRAKYHARSKTRWLSVERFKEEKGAEFAAPRDEIFVVYRRRDGSFVFSTSARTTDAIDRALQEAGSASRAVAELVSEGKTHAEIAAIRGISESRSSQLFKKFRDAFFRCYDVRGEKPWR